MPLDTDKNRPIATTAHWGTYYAEVENGKLTGLRDYEKDPSPSIIGQGILEALDLSLIPGRTCLRLQSFLQVPHGHEDQSPSTLIMYQSHTHLIPRQSGTSYHCHRQGLYLPTYITGFPMQESHHIHAKPQPSPHS